MQMVNRALKFSFYSLDSTVKEGEQKCHLLSEREYSMPEIGWNVDFYIDLIDRLEVEFDCYLFEEPSKNLLTFHIHFPSGDRRNAESKVEILKKIMGEISPFFERMEKLGAMV